MKKEVEKEILSTQLYQGGNPLSRYKMKVLGKDKGYLHLAQFELCQLLFANLGGGVGYLLRRIFMAPLFKECGKGLILGKGVVVRTPGNISIGKNLAVDDLSQLDGGTGGNCNISCGDGVIISKGSVIQAKSGPVEIGDECDLGAHCILTSVGGIHLEKNVLVAGNCYFGGARYHTELRDVPIMYQQTYSRGPICIGEGTWIGASVTILDGVTIGQGCVIGAGSVVTKDISDYSIAVGVPATVMARRE